MIWVDIAIIALLVIYSIVGLIRGYFQEAYAIAVWLLGVVVAWFFCQDFAILLKSFGTTSTRTAASFVALVLITLTVGGTINMVLAIRANKTSLTFIQRSGGLVLGFAQGLLVTFALVLVAGLTSMPKDRWWLASKYLPPFQSLATGVKKNIHTKLANSINYINNPEEQVK
jgi:membrane protein required for colicin V production